MIGQIYTTAYLEAAMEKIEDPEYQQLAQVIKNAGMNFKYLYSMAPSDSELIMLEKITSGRRSEVPRAQSVNANANTVQGGMIIGNEVNEIFDLHRAFQALNENANLKNPLISPGALRATAKEKDKYQAFASACSKLSKMINESCTEGSDPYIKIGQAIASDLPHPANEFVDADWKSYCIDLRQQLNNLAKKALEQSNRIQNASRQKLDNFLVGLIYIRIKDSFKLVPRTNSKEEIKKFKDTELADITQKIWEIYFSQIPNTKVTITKTRRVIKELNSRSKATKSQLHKKRG